MHCPVNLLFIQVESQNAVITCTGQEHLSLMNADALAIIQVGVLPGTGLPELLVVSQQAIARCNVDRVAVDRDATQAATAFLAKPLDIREVVVDFFEDGLVGEVNQIGATVDLTLGGAMNNRRYQ